jgi:hypothetical protein
MQRPATALPHHRVVLLLRISTPPIYHIPTRSLLHRTGITSPTRKRRMMMRKRKRKRKRTSEKKRWLRTKARWIMAVC